jgi:hypothetical protein
MGRHKFMRKINPLYDIDFFFCESYDIEIYTYPLLRVIENLLCFPSLPLFWIFFPSPIYMSCILADSISLCHS